MMASLIRVKPNFLVDGYIIRRNHSDFMLVLDDTKLENCFRKCYELGDPDNAYRGGKISNPIFELYYNEFKNNGFISMPKDNFSLIEVKIPLWDGKEYGYYLEKNELHDMYSLYRNKEIFITEKIGVNI